MNRKSYFLIISILFLLVSCSDNRWNNIDNQSLPKLKIDHIDFDLALMNYSQDNLKTLISKNFNNKEILGYLFLDCLSFGLPTDSLFYQSVDLFKKDKYIIELEQEIDITLRNKLSGYNQLLDDKFARLAYYLPNKPLPTKIFWINSLFSSSVFCTLNEIGVGLERYVGPQKKVIKQLPSEQFFQWMKDGMISEFLVRDVLVNWIYTHYLPENENGVLVQRMIEWGKVYYILHAIYPELPFNTLLRYNQSKYEWCDKNEIQVWKYLVSQSLVFSKNERDHSNFLNEGPFTPGLPEKGPDRLGQYLGWKMVYNYMENHESLSLKDLIKVPYNSILQEYQID